jgi:hypothetical protein
MAKVETNLRDQWSRRYSNKSKEDQVNSLLYYGRQIEDILSFNLTMTRKAATTVLKPKAISSWRNVIYERAKFQFKIATGETVDDFITSLYPLAEHCEYAALHVKWYATEL